jgi:hypothetical protein
MQNFHTGANREYSLILAPGLLFFLAQHPYDQVSKQYPQDFLEPNGIITRNIEVLRKPKFIDAYFFPINSSKAAKSIGSSDTFIPMAE